MQAADLIKYIRDPRLLGKESVAQLQELVRDFPYFQSAHVLLSVASRKWDTSVYQQSLKKAAVVAANRAHLFRLMQYSMREEQQGELPEQELPVAEPVQEDTYQEDSRQELNILKAAEISTTGISPAETAEQLPAEAPALEPEQEKKIPVPVAEEVLEREIGREVVNSFVEAKLLKVPEPDPSPEPEPEKPESFSDWLSFLKKNNGQPYREIEEQVYQEKARQEAARKSREQEDAPAPDTKPQESRRARNLAIIDKIIENSPGIIRPKEEQRFYAPDIKAKESLLENEHLVTETLAKIYALQGSINKAIRAYEILSMKHPQKRVYYDNQIQKLKNNG
jgi:hypothetical protein